MSVTILHKHSETPAAVPGTADLVAGQVALNAADKTWFTKTTDNTVVCLNQLLLLDGGVVSV